MLDLSSPINVGPELFLLDLGIDLHLQGARVPGHPVSLLVAGRGVGPSHSPPVDLALFLSFCLSRLYTRSYMIVSIISTAIQSSETIFLCLENVYFGGFG